MMALNIAVPLATVGDLMDGFGLLSPISPLSVDCHGVTTAGSHGKQQLVSPVGSESSGVSSLDSDEMKKPSSPPTTPTEEVGRPSTSSPLPSPEMAEPELPTMSEISEPKSSGCSSSTRSSLSSSDSISSSNEGSSSDEFLTATATDLPAPEPVPPKEVKVEIGGRDVLNLMDNLISPNHFRLQYAQLPENDNVHFFLHNRSQYHRLGSTGHIQEYTIVKCKCCDFRYPECETSPPNEGGTTASMGQANLAAVFQQQQQQQQAQQQQQQQSFQWKNFNNYDSISNRNKMGVNVAVNAFNKTFGGGNNGSQYFRNNMATSLFGRDSNRSSNNNSGGNFVNSNSTNTYNNPKAYQQGYGSSSNNGSNKFGSQYGNYQFQQQQQSQQQQLFSKTQQMRYAISNSNGSAALAAAASALANQNMLNFNNFNGKNMAAYFDARMN